MVLVRCELKLSEQRTAMRYRAEQCQVLRAKCEMRNAKCEVRSADTASGPNEGGLGKLWAT